MALRRWPALAIANSLGRLVEGACVLLPERLTGALDLWLCDERIQRRLNQVFKKSPDPLLAGHARDFADRHWPAEAWPTLYLDIPDDVRRPILWDGRLPGGGAPSWLAWRHFDASVLGAAFRAGARAGLAWALTVVIVLLAITGVRTAVEESGPHPYPSWATEAGVTAPIVWWYVERIAGIVIGTGQSLILTIVAGLAAGLAAAYFSAARLLADWWDKASAPLATPTRDSLVLYDARADVRPGEYLAYVRQVQAAAGRLASQPLLPIGRATGTLRARGDMESPAADQLMALDGESIRQHVLALGAAGTGKTRLLMGPLFGRVMDAPWGPDHRIGAFVLDGKGLLWRELVPEVAGRTDVRVIGTAPDQFGADLLADLSAADVAVFLRAAHSALQGGRPRTVGAELATGSGLRDDAGWSDAATLLVTHAATLCLVLDADTQTRTAWTELGFRPWSLLGIGQTACLAERQIQAMRRVRGLREARADNVPAEMRILLTAPEVAAAIEWLECDWALMSPVVRSGVIAALRSFLDDCWSPGTLRDRFASGLCDHTVDVSHALNGGILMAAVGDAEGGTAGRLVALWLKSRFYTLARRKLETTRGRFRDTSVALFVDDFQQLATVGPESDETFWAVAREAGVFLVAATRSLAALRHTMGEAAAGALLEAIRTKIVLQTEEADLTDYLLRVAGELPRGLSDDNLPETQAIRERDMPDVAPPLPDARGAVRWGCIPCRPPLGAEAWPEHDGWQARRTTRGQRPTTHASGSRVGVQSGMSSWLGSACRRVSAGGRSAASSTSAATVSISWRPKLSVNDLLLGSGLAFAIVQRAGMYRADIIDLTRSDLAEAAL